jgi:hypothetical protein
MRSSGNTDSNWAAMAPLPVPISSALPAGRIPCSAQGSTTRRAKARYGRLVASALSSADISAITWLRPVCPSIVPPVAAAVAPVVLLAWVQVTQLGTATLPELMEVLVQLLPGSLAGDADGTSDLLPGRTLLDRLTSECAFPPDQVRLEGAGRGERGGWVRVGRGRLPGRHHRVRDMPGTRLRTAVCFHPVKVSLTGWGPCQGEPDRQRR